jgi:ketosteroid isomerase-like protein
VEKLKARPGGPVAQRSRRTLEERLIVAVPWLYRLVVSLALRLPIDFRFRSWIIARQIRSGWGAISRGDIDLMLARYAQDVEFIADERFQALGVESPARGQAAARRYIEGIRMAFRTWEFSLHAFIDLGDRLVTLGTHHVQGSASGAAITEEFAQVLDLAGGLVIRESDHWSWDAALATAGLSRGQIEGLKSQHAPSQLGIR